MTFYVAMRLRDEVTWVQISGPFDTREDAEQYVARNYPSWVRPDVFHGMQPLQIAESKHDHPTSNRADSH